MLYICLMASMSKTGKTKIMVWEKQCKINGKGSGNLLLKVIIQESHLDIKKDMKRRCSKRFRRSLKYVKEIGTIKYFPKKNKLGNWVNELMHNTSMTNTLATCLTAIAMTAKTTNTPRIDNIIWMDTESVPIGIDNFCSLSLPIC